MNIFVTVGTTKFSSLVNEASLITDHQITIQHADPTRDNLFNTSFDFVDSIDDFYEAADLVVTHAGAGSVYSLLERKKKVIVVPNLERIDQHQMDLAKYVEQNHYALVAWAPTQLIHSIKESESFIPAPYQPLRFSKYKEISDFLKS
ncbi:PssE/Cps14G family polysaccharide biosynthesis glycosyltransferase [Aliagarivorans marinus]|uniref:PssE/Cps14G family polysaccharide biosynthesis glycosyltransferase n=1 Tax=Aliagarivorans marinus TaxID=561965 RepID=UPI00047B8BAF|nr:PssE/Cps14G family polysaccharide biosynthesis glycosyltransferase [Aliagarivorans marinus]